MVKVVVIGAGIAGLSAALALGHRGHDVHVYEADSAPVPDDPEAMWAAWPRPGVPQARLFHSFHGLARKVLRERAPDVFAALLEAGAVERNLVAGRVPGGDAEPGDDDLGHLYCRRKVFEGVLRLATEADSDVTMHVGCGVDGLLTRPSHLDGIPQIVGVHTREGNFNTDVVVDASGRRSRIVAWLAAAGAPPPLEESADCGVIYYSRHFALRPDDEGRDAAEGGQRPQGIGFDDLGYLRYSLTEEDNGTFVANFFVPPWDRELRALSREASFMAAFQTIPAVAPWIDPHRSVSISGVEAMGNLRNTLRRFVVDARPVALGLHVIGDALCHTNPVLGYGSSIALRQAWLLADLLDEEPSDPVAQALAFDARTAEDLRSWYTQAVGTDRLRQRRWRGEPEIDVTDPEEDFSGFVRTVLDPAMNLDPVVFRAMVRLRQLLDPPHILQHNREIHQRARAALAARAERTGSPPRHVPTREELLSVFSGIGSATPGVHRPGEAG